MIYHRTFPSPHDSESPILKQKLFKTYTVLFEACKRVALRLAQLDLGTVCRQYHSDLHLGENLARARAFPNSLRCADFAHLIGATTRPKRDVPPPCERITAWRSGIFSAAKKALSIANKQLTDWLRPWIHLLRTIPTAESFHTIADTLLRQMEYVFGEPACAKVLRDHYFVRVPAAVAQAAFGVTSWIGDQTFLWSADWWAGVQRAQPGSASGSQAQESWHRHKLKAHVHTLRQEMHMAVRSLSEFSMSRCRVYCSSEALLPDTPADPPFPDTHLLMGDFLDRRGRTGAFQYQDTGAFRKVVGVDGSRWYAMRRTLATYNADTRNWHPTANSDVPMPPMDLVARLRALYEADSRETMLAALAMNGVQDLFADNMNSLYRAFAGKVLVVVGPKSERYWAFPVNPSAASSMHTRAVCQGCVEAAIHGTCEHIHTALLDMNLIQRQAANMPVRKGKGRGDSFDALSSPGPHTSGILLPGPAARACHPAPPPTRPLAPETPRCDRRLARLLTDVGLGHLQESFRLEGITFELAAGLDAPTLKAYFPDIPLGAALKLLHQIRLHSESDMEQLRPALSPLAEPSGIPSPEIHGPEAGLALDADASFQSDEAALVDDLVADSEDNEAMGTSDADNPGDDADGVAVVDAGGVSTPGKDGGTKSEVSDGEEDSTSLQIPSAHHLLAARVGLMHGTYGRYASSLPSRA